MGIIRGGIRLAHCILHTICKQLGLHIQTSGGFLYDELRGHSVFSSETVKMNQIQNIKYLNRCHDTVQFGLKKIDRQRVYCLLSFNGECGEYSANVILGRVSHNSEKIMETLPEKRVKRGGFQTG